MKNKDKITKFLTDSGYHKGRNILKEDYLCFFRSIWKDQENLKYECVCNDKVQLCVYYHEMEFPNGTKTSGFEIEICHEPNFDVWIDFKIYSLTEEQVYANLKMYEQKLITAWNAINE